MAHLVRGKVVERERGRENGPPRERQYARVRAGAPTARLVAHVDALDGNAELGRVAPLAASRSRCASRLRKSLVRRSTCGGSPATHSSQLPASSVSVHTVPRTPRRLTMRCGSPPSGPPTPGANGAAPRKRLSPAAIQPPRFFA